MNQTSESGAGASKPAPDPAFPRRWRAALLLGVAIVIFAADQLSKNWVIENLSEGQSVPVLGEFLQWHFVRNPGAAFSMASGVTWIFTILATIVVVVILWQIRRLGSWLWALFFGLLLGGVLGNLTDRLTREPGFPVGHVIDFISTPWMMPAIYNIADSAIVVGMVLFVLISLLGFPLSGGQRHRKEDQKADDSEADDSYVGRSETGGSDTGSSSTSAGLGDEFGDELGKGPEEPR